MPTNQLGYLIADEEWWADMMVSILLALVSLLLVLSLTYTIFGIFWGFILGTDIWIVLVSFAVPYFSLSVPEVTGLMVQNYFKQSTQEDAFANMMVYPTGFHPRMPWKKIVSYIDLRQVTIPFNEDFPARNGVLIRFRGNVLYLPQIEWIPIYIAVSAETIKATLMSVVTSWLSQKVGRSKTPETARRQIRAFQEGLMRRFEEVKEELAKEERESGVGQIFERRLGINITRVVIADVGYAESYQKALTDRAGSAILQEVAVQWQTGGLSPKDAANAAFINAGKVRKTVTEFEGARDIARIIANGLVQAFAPRTHRK